jgi:oligoendopeptidase F
MIFDTVGNVLNFMLPVFFSNDSSQELFNMSENSRSAIAEKYKWNLTDLFRSVDDWRAAKSKVEKQLPAVENLKGSLVSSADNLFTGLDMLSMLEKEFARLYAYAMMLSDEDTRESGPLALKQEMAQLETKLNSAAAFMSPEILTLSAEKLQQFFGEEPRLETYRQSIDDIYRRKAHTLDDRQEKIIAEAGLMSDTAQESYSILSNADLPYPTIKLSDGREVLLDATGYSLHRTEKNRADRQQVFESFYSALKTYNRTFGTQLYGEVKKNMFYKNVRNYPSSLHSSLDRNNIPVDVYHNLVDSVNRHLPTMHRYLNLRRRMLGLEDLRYYDIYPSLVKDVDLDYSYDQAREAILASLQPMGDEYVGVVKRSFDERWIDVYPTPGKRSGAYMEGIAYDEHPYILMNYKGKYDDVSTLTHELGHAMHSYYSNKHQPYVNSHYPIFLAEVASTVNEALLLDYVLNNITDPRQRLALLGNALEGFRGTLFRQTQFAEFELRIHELAESGEALTGDRFTELYLEIFRKYYGHEKGVTRVDDLYGLEWAFIPHFYYNFYVFQYSTSFTASQAIVEKILAGEEGIIDKYRTFLSSGCSEYAIPTLQKVGVDMTGNEPFELTMRRINQVMDEMEKLAGI